MWEILQKRLLPDESIQTLQRSLVAAIAGLGTILLGTLFIWAVTLLIKVSKPTIFGYWGVAAVLAGAGVVTLLVWQKYTRKDKCRKPASNSENNDEPVVIPPPVPRIVDSPIPSIIPDPPDDKINNHPELNLPPQPSRPSPIALKGRFNNMIDNGRLDEAESILAQLQILPEQSEWCKNAQRRLADERQRSS